MVFVIKYDYESYEISLNIGNFGFIQTCNSRPCQFDVVYLQEDQEPWQVGYVRLRGGRLRCDFPDVGGETIYCYNYGDDKYRGDFIDETDRMYHLNLIAYAIKKKLDAISYGYS